MIGHAQPSSGDAVGEQSLRTAYVSLREQLANNAFQRPLLLESVQREHHSKGEIHAVLSHSFADLSAALKGGEQWCDVLILHPTTKQCRASAGASDKRLTVSIGRKLDQSVESAHRVEFELDSQNDGSDYLQVRLRAGEGPLGTYDYRITFEAVPLDPGRSFVRLSYAYGHGIAARLVMDAYLSTVARDKVGFTVVGRSDGRPVYVGSVRGAIERNVMRYYLAIDAYLGSLAAVPGERDERRLREWFAATARYAQLREADEAEYLRIKRREISRQREASPS